MTAVAVAAVILAGVFTLSAGTKLASPSRTASAAHDLGLPSVLATPVGWVLAPVELGLAVGLLVPGALRIAAAAILALLVTFSAVTVAALITGRRPTCHCFGNLHPVPIGRATLIRNVALAGLTTLVLFAGQDSVWRVGQYVTSVELLGLLIAALFAVVAVLAWMVVQLSRQHGRLLVRLDELQLDGQSLAGVEDGIEGRGLPINTPAPMLELPDQRGHLVSLAQRWVDRPALLVFLDESCAPCRDLAPDVLALAARAPEAFTVTVVTLGDWLDEPARNLPPLTILCAGLDVASQFGCPGTPAAVLVGTDGRMAAARALGSDAIVALITKQLGTSAADAPARMVSPDSSPVAASPAAFHVQTAARFTST